MTIQQHNFQCKVNLQLRILTCWGAPDLYWRDSGSGGPALFGTVCEESETPRSEHPLGLLDLETYIHTFIGLCDMLTSLTTLMDSIHRLVTKFRFVQQTDEDAKWLEVVHEDALLFPAPGSALQDPHHGLQTQTAHNSRAFFPHYFAYDIWHN